MAILSFHNVGHPPPDGWDTWFYTPESVFVNQLEYLRANGWKVIDRDGFLNGICSPHTLPERAVMITFDDGCRQFLDVAFPWLRRFKFPAVYFVCTRYIGGFNAFARYSEPREPMLTWKDLRQLERGNVAVESHAVSHRTFSELTRRQRNWEVRRSKAVLEEKLGKRIRMFAYPYGDFGGDRPFVTAALQQADYRAAFLYGGKPVRLPRNYTYFLPRLPMGPDSNLGKMLGAR